MNIVFIRLRLGRVSQSVGQRSWVRYPIWSHTLRGAVVSYRQKYVHEILVNRLGGLSLPRKSVVRLTDRPAMTLDVYRGRKTITQQQQQIFVSASPTGWERTGQMLCIVDTSLSVLMTLRMCLRELCCVFTVWI